uniref:Uncharacterized protein n=1 Tax=Meloidogyne enterolobii TaxID=390850 RepID=A0A6V7TWL0_MELEN|nr:unnamed protein product [Meloidogyne enterolobii]
MSHNKNRQQRLHYNNRPQRLNQKFKRNKENIYKLKSQFVVDRNDNERLKQQNRNFRLSKLIVMKPSSSLDNNNRTINCKLVKKENKMEEEAKIILKLKEFNNISINLFIKEEIKTKLNKKEEKILNKNVEEGEEIILKINNNGNYLNNFATKIENKEQNGDCYINKFSSCSTNLKTEFRKSSIINSVDLIWAETNSHTISINSSLICQPKESIKELEPSSEIVQSEQKNSGYLSMNFVYEFFSKIFKGKIKMSHNKNKQQRLHYNNRPQRLNQKFKRNKENIFKLKSQFVVDRNDNERLKQQKRNFRLSKLIVMKPSSSLDNNNRTINCKLVKKENKMEEEAKIILKLKEFNNISINLFIKEEIKTKLNKKEEKILNKNVEEGEEIILKINNNGNYLNNFATKIENKEQNGDCYINKFSSCSTNLKTEFRKSSIINSVDLIWAETNSHTISINSSLICQPKESIKELEPSSEIVQSEQKNSGYLSMNFVYEFFSKIFKG